MPQTIDKTLFDRAAKKLNEGARAIAPDWLADLLTPAESSVEITDMLTPMGSIMSKGTGLISKVADNSGWTKLLKGLKKNPVNVNPHNSSASQIDGMLDAPYGQGILGQNTPFGTSSFIKDMNVLDDQIFMERNEMLNQLASKGSQPAKPTIEMMEMGNARQRMLPVDTTIISHDPNVSPRTAEKAGHTLNNILRKQPGQPSDYVASMHIGPEGGNSAMHRNGARRMTIADDEDIGEVINSVGHETQHAVDLKQNPQMFKDYPSTLFSSLTGPSKGYYRHPSETIARASGNLEQFKHKSREAGQSILDQDFLKQFEHAKEGITGEVQEDIWDMIRSGRPQKHKEMQDVRSINKMTFPYQPKFDFEGMLRETIDGRK